MNQARPSFEALRAGWRLVLEELLEVLATPDDHERDPAGFGEPGPRERLCQTFCGT